LRPTERNGSCRFGNHAGVGSGSNEAIGQSRHGAGIRKIDKLLKIAVVSFERDSGALKCLT